jgi:hypothetical protein
MAGRPPSGVADINSLAVDYQAGGIGKNYLRGYMAEERTQ